MASPITARAGKGLIDDVPLPDAAVPASTRDVPAPYSQFAGAWAGRWGNMLDHILIVEAISKSGEAQVIYATGDQPEWKMNHSWERRTARIAGSHMAVQGISATYDVMPDGRLSARHHSVAPG